MTPCSSLALTSAPPLSAAGLRGPGKATSVQPEETKPGKDLSGLWLRNAATGLCVLAAAAATVSFTAQYRMVDATRHLPAIAALEAAIPDAAAWSSPAWASPWPCTAAARSAPGPSTWPRSGPAYS